MKYRTGKDKTSEVRVYKNVPKGWKILKGTTAQPVGTAWVSNGEPLFKRGQDGKMHKNPEYKHALVVQDEQLMVMQIAEDRRRGGGERFISDATTETKIQSEMRRQDRERKKIERDRERKNRADTKSIHAKYKPAKKQSALRVRKK